MLENEPVTIYRGAQIFRKFLYNYRDQLSASVLVAGWDEQNGGQVSANIVSSFSVWIFIPMFSYMLYPSVVL